MYKFHWLQKAQVKSIRHDTRVKIFLQSARQRGVGQEISKKRQANQWRFRSKVYSGIAALPHPHLISAIYSYRPIPLRIYAHCAFRRPFCLHDVYCVCNTSQRRTFLYPGPGSARVLANQCVASERRGGELRPA